LIYNFEGQLINTLVESFNKPTDVLVNRNKLFVANYGENTVSIYKKD